MDSLLLIFLLVGSTIPLVLEMRAYISKFVFVLFFVSSVVIVLAEVFNALWPSLNSMDSQNSDNWTITTYMEVFLIPYLCITMHLYLKKRKVSKEDIGRKKKK